jgi:hypothetical protein
MKNNFVRDPERTKRYQKTHRKPQTDNGANTIQQIADYERISGYVWIVLGVIQIVTVIGIIAGIWNVFAGWTRLKIVPNILARNADIPESFEGISTDPHSAQPFPIFFATTLPPISTARRSAQCVAAPCPLKSSFPSTITVVSKTGTANIVISESSVNFVRATTRRD